jgi:hypothetical protein
MGISMFGATTRKRRKVPDPDVARRWVSQLAGPPEPGCLLPVTEPGDAPDCDAAVESPCPPVIPGNEFKLIVFGASSFAFRSSGS